MRMPIFRGAKRWGILLSVVLLASLLLAACGGNSPTILDPRGDVGLKESNLFWFILVVATIVFVAVESALIYSIIRYRERPNTPMPNQIHGNNTIEIIWTVAPSLFLFAVLIGTIYTMFTLPPSAPTALEVKVVAHQWWWEFDYNVKPNYGFVTADELHIPLHSTVRVDLESTNVIHSFWVPQLTGKTDVIPGHNNYILFNGNTAGTYRGECAEYCGTQHAHMDFSVIVEPQDTFNTWVSTQQQAAPTPTDSAAVAGQKLFLGAGGCQGCHGIVGVNLSDYFHLKSGSSALNLVGPNLTHFGSRHDIAGGVLMWDPASCQVVNGQLVNKDACGLYKWLQNPQAIKPGSDMVIGPLTDTQIAQLVAYLETLK